MSVSNVESKWVDGNLVFSGAGAVKFNEETPNVTARTATADGTGTGTIADAARSIIAVTSAGANNIMVLPAPVPGTEVELYVGANGYELRSSAPATVGINGGTGAGAESAIPANSYVHAVCVSATAWLAFQVASDGTTAGVEAAA